MLLVCPRDRAVACSWISGFFDLEVVVPRRYPAEFRRKVLDLVEAGRPVAVAAADLGVTARSIYNWRNQDQVDRGLRPGVGHIGAMPGLMGVRAEHAQPRGGRRCSSC